MKIFKNLSSFSISKPSLANVFGGNIIETTPNAQFSNGDVWYDSDNNSAISAGDTICSKPNDII